MDSVVDKQIQRFKNPDGGFSTVAAQTAVGVQQEPLGAMGSLAIEGHGVRQGVHDVQEILRRVRRSFTSDRRISRQIHTRQM